MKTTKRGKMHIENGLRFSFFLLIAILLYSFVVEKGNMKDGGSFLPDKKDSIAANQPKIDIKVNKKYDEKGNLIQYDSSYSIIYTSPNLDTQFFNFDNDSLFSVFKSRMNRQDLLNDDFFKGRDGFGINHDFFRMNPGTDFKQLEEMMDKMRRVHAADSTLFQPQQKNQPLQETTTPNMITL